MHNFYRVIKVVKNIWATFVIFKILPIENNCQLAGNSPDLVTLVENQVVENQVVEATYCRNFNVLF
jgi:hypothetical protein